MKKYCIPLFNSHFASILLSAFLLCLMAFHNAYPLTFNYDTGAYIENGFYGTVAADRPILYSLFIYFVSLQQSLWFIIIMQSFIVSVVIYYFFRHFTRDHISLRFYLGYVALISLFMGASFNASWLMPDIFTSVSILCIALLIFANNLKTADIIIISLLTVISIGMHNSHFIICLVLSGVAVAGYFINRIRNVYEKASIMLKRVLLTLLLILMSNLALRTIHYYHGGNFIGSRGGIVFLMSNLVEMGIIDAYLAENCESKHYNICAFKDSIPNNFLWAPNSPIQKTGGWAGNEAEYNAIIKDIITTPKYLFNFIYKSGINTIKQAFNYDIVDFAKPGSRVNDAIEIQFNGDYRAFLKSRQMNERLSFGFVNFIQNMITGICLFIYFLVFFYKRMSVRYRLLIIFILSGIIINAWVCSTFSGVYPRYQLRVVWLLPLPLFLYLMENRSLKLPISVPTKFHK